MKKFIEWLEMRDTGVPWQNLEDYVRNGMRVSTVKLNHGGDEEYETGVWSMDHGMILQHRSNSAEEAQQAHQKTVDGLNKGMRVRAVQHALDHQLM
jgi:hypothetical protein